MVLRLLIGRHDVRIGRW